MTHEPPAVVLRVDTRDPTPPYEQLRRQVADLVAAGVLRAGERLPPLRQLAADLGLAVGTVARAYRELEGAGLVVSRRGGGTRVADGVDVAPTAVLTALAAHAQGYVREAHRLGVDPEVAVRLVREALAHAAASPT